MPNQTATNKAHTKVLWGLFTFFSAFLLFMIWWFEFRWVGSYDELAVSFVGTQNAPNISGIQDSSGRPLVIHFVDPSCDCNRFSEPHINHISIYALQHTQNLIAYSAPPQPASLLLRTVKDDTFLQHLNSWIPASPAVAIWDKRGKLAYFGPYSSGAICGRGDDLVQYTLDNLAKGINPHWINQEAVGCYCPWPDSSH